LKIITVSKMLLNPITLPGMGKSIELGGLSVSEAAEIKQAFAANELFVEFQEEPGRTVQVVSLWPNPHSSQITVFVK
jgi:hypothetical protein